jgi:uracil-DNA glycosylase family 4
MAPREVGTGREAQYQELVTARRACRRCSGLTNPSLIAGGHYDSNEIGPYTRWQGNRQAELLVVAQDFADVESFIRFEGWPGEGVQTNLALRELLNVAGFEASGPVKGVSDDVVFLTNAVLCMKPGNMGSKVPGEYFDACGRRFLRPTIELLHPRAVVALGGDALRAIRSAYGTPGSPRLKQLVERTPAGWLSERTALFVRYHPSPRVQNTHRSKAEQMQDWERIGTWLRDTAT